MSAAPSVSVVVVSYNTREHLLRCLGSVEAHAGMSHETLVVDNASRDGSAEAVRAAFPSARVLANEANLGFSRANNRALAEARATLCLLLNSDAELLAGSLPSLVAALEARPDVAVAGPRTVGASGLVEVSFGPDLRPLAEWRQRRLVRGLFRGEAAAVARAEALASAEREPDWVSGSCLLARRRALEQVGGFDEGFFLYEEDADLCLRLRRAGWRVLFTPAATVRHHHGRSMAGEPVRAPLEYHRSHLRYYRKHGGALLTGLLRVHLALRALGQVTSADAGRRDLAGRLLRLALRGE